MFKKLLSNLPFNPSLIGQVGFYAKRLNREASVRRLGVIFIALSFAVQFIAAIAPSESTLARSGNDVVPGGFSSRTEVTQHCNSNRYKLKTILERFGVSCSAVSRAGTINLNSRDYNSRLYSMGRLPYGKTGEVSVNISGAGTFYMRPLWSWDSGSSSTYKALKGVRADGTPFMILYSCGNLVIVGPPSPPPPPPPPPPKIVRCTNLSMSVENKSEVKLGTSISLIGQAAGKNINQKTEKLKMYYRMYEKSSGKLVDSKLANGVSFKNGVAQDPHPRVFTLNKEGKFIFKLRVTRNNNGTPITVQGSDSGNCIKQVTVKKDLPCIDVSDDDDVTACLILSKKASNDTRDIEDADGTVAKANDQVTYTLFAKNTSNNTAVKGYVIQENLSDVLEYSDVVDLHGGSIDEENIVSWPPLDIDTGATIEKKITVKVKNPIPKTPISSSNPGSYDCTMTNVFSDTVNIKLNCGAAKKTEQISTALPNTGPGETLAVAFVVTTLAGYFLARTKLMSKELDSLKKEYVSGGNA